MAQPSNPASLFGGRDFSFAIPPLSLGEAGAVVLFFALACLAVMIVDTGLLDHDVSWYLVATRRWMAGVMLYDGVIEINPPLMFYLTRLSYAIAAPLGLADKPALLLFLGLAALLCFAFVAALLRRSALSSNQRGVFLCFVSISLFLVPLSVFGQREHFLIIFLLPLAMWMAFWPMNPERGLELPHGTAPSRGSDWRVWLPHSEMVGVACALFALSGLLLKPHFLLLPAIAIGLRLVQCRATYLCLPPTFFSPTNIVLALGAFGYLSFIWLVHPLYYERIVPFALLVYGGFGILNSSLIFKPIALFILLPLVVVFLLFVGWKLYHSAHPRPWPPSAVLFCYLVGAILSTTLQQKGFLYHFLPIQSFLFFTAIAFILTNLDFHYRKRFIYATAGSLFLHIMLYYRTPYPKPVDRLAYPRQIDAWVNAKIAGLAEKSQSALVLSSWLPAAFPMVNEHKWRWTSRYPSQWLLPGAWNQFYGPERDSLSQEKLAKLEAVLDYSRRTTVDDFINESPDVVIVAKHPKKNFFYMLDFDYITFLDADPRFAEAWREYRKLSELPPDWEMYIRMDNASVKKVSVDNEPQLSVASSR